MGFVNTPPFLEHLHKYLKENRVEFKIEKVNSPEDVNANVICNTSGLGAHELNNYNQYIQLVFIY